MMMSASARVSLCGAPARRACEPVGARFLLSEAARASFPLKAASVAPRFLATSFSGYPLAKGYTGLQSRHCSPGALNPCARDCVPKTPCVCACASQAMDANDFIRCMQLQDELKRLSD
eukprot:1530900-Pleurochrysis_carterae.AAC.1